MTLKAKEIEKMEIEEIDKKINELQMELLKLRLQSKIGTLKNTASIRNTKKDIARLLTIKIRKEREKPSSANSNKT
ncbi:50S ribosomal protein L29 [Sulfuracidifex tepidarius]|uniref:Large ribosomal subunit protein uL29 n=1 Tax=Sulfuracidifex tepidarius TaxID=1294262 RepID=A0A510DW23_9CREN|nr:50S ribosomal protein L29 [Sulfuracidifex tepidarius]BBG24395.1 50S ribosomal protein L29 [Sulfuracidifex tepidarius]BBG27153.1 50S ribosomal protein L29 [Sulfuracidifex tepidarius]